VSIVVYYLVLYIMGNLSTKAFTLIEILIVIVVI